MQGLGKKEENPKIALGFKTEIRPKKVDIEYFWKSIRVKARIYNWVLDVQKNNKEEYKLRDEKPKYISSFEISRMATQYLKEEGNAWMQDVDNWTIRSAVNDADSAFKSFFRNVKLNKLNKKKKNPGYPRYKSWRKVNSFRIHYGNLDITDDTIRIPKLGVIKIKEHGYLPIGKRKEGGPCFTKDGILYTVNEGPTISTEGGRWFISVPMTSTIDIPDYGGKTMVCGIDLNLKPDSYITIYPPTPDLTNADGKITNPKYYKSSMKKLARSQRSASKSYNLIEDTILLNRIEEGGSTFSDLQKKRESPPSSHNYEVKRKLERGYKSQHLKNILNRLEKKKIIRKEGNLWIRNGSKPEIPLGKNLEKKKAKVTKLHYKIACQRSDLLHKVSSRITEEYSDIGMEDLSIKAMMSTGGPKEYMGRKIQQGNSRSWTDASAYTLRHMIEYKAARKGKQVHVYDVKEIPSTQLCSNCGNRKKGEDKLERGDRTYTCQACGMTIDRDMNSARNSFRVADGQSVTACGGPSPDSPAREMIHEGPEKQEKLKPSSSATARGSLEIVSNSDLSQPIAGSGLENGINNKTEEEDHKEIATSREINRGLYTATVKDDDGGRQ